MHWLTCESRSQLILTMGNRKPQDQGNPCACILGAIQRGHRHPVTALAVSSDGRFVFSGSASFRGKIKQWDVFTGKVDDALQRLRLRECADLRARQLVRNMNGDACPAASLSLSSDGRFLFCWRKLSDKKETWNCSNGTVYVERRPAIAICAG